MVKHLHNFFKQVSKLMKLDHVQPDTEPVKKRSIVLYSLHKTIFLISLLLVGHYWSFAMPIWKQILLLVITFAIFDLYETLLRIR